MFLVNVVICYFSIIVNSTRKPRIYFTSNIAETCANPEGGQGVQTRLKNHKFIGFYGNAGPDPLNITKLPSQASTMGHYCPASETPFQ